MEIIMQKIIPLSLLLTLTLSACGESIKTKEELSQLPIEEYSVEVCQAILDMNLDQLSHMLSERELSDLQDEINEKSIDFLKDYLEDRVKCDDAKVKLHKERRGYNSYIARLHNLELKIREENKAFTIRSIKVEG